MDRTAVQERFGILGNSSALHRVIDRVRQVARGDVTVLLQGESGVGKELVAQAIHALSPRRHGSFVVVNCGAIPEGLIESELFGAEKGAYTGSVERRTGYFEEANGGTIFLDEIGEMPAQAQVRLLRVLESGSYSRVGSSSPRQTDARVVAATNRDLGREVQSGRFREDLYYRLSTVLIDIPPLRERREDIPVLFDHFLRRAVQKYDAGLRRLDESAYELLTGYGWPGNIRELRNVAEQAALLLRGDTVTADDLRPFLRGVTANTSGLLPVRLADVAGANAAPDESRERELLYRALLELRMDVREMKEQLAQLVTGVKVTREDFERHYAPRGESFVIVRDGAGTFEQAVEDVPYEIEQEREGASSPANPESGDDLPTLEESERDLIAQALRRFEGNRRQTAQALGISERTLYRKIKELEEQGIAI